MKPQHPHLESLYPLHSVSYQKRLSQFALKVHLVDLTYPLELHLDHYHRSSNSQIWSSLLHHLDQRHPFASKHCRAHEVCSQNKH